MKKTINKIKQVYRSTEKWFTQTMFREVVVLDEAGNVLFLDGNPHESISAHCGNVFAVYAKYLEHKPCLFCVFVKWLIEVFLARWFPWLVGHCSRAWKAERPMVLASIKSAGVNATDPGGPI